MDNTSILYNRRIALVVLTQNTTFFHDLCVALHDCAAHLTAVSIDGQLTSGWDAGESTRIGLTESDAYVAMVLILDKAGASQLSKVPEAVTFIKSFVADNKPSVTIGEEEGYIQSIGLMSEEDNVSSEFNSDSKIRRFKSLVTVSSDCSAQEFAEIIKSEICHKLHLKD